MRIKPADPDADMQDTQLEILAQLSEAVRSKDHVRLKNFLLAPLTSEELATLPEDQHLYRQQIVSKKLVLEVAGMAISRKLANEFVIIIETRPEICAEIFTEDMTEILDLGPEIAMRFIELAKYTSKDFDVFIKNSAALSRVKTYKFFRALGGSVEKSEIYVAFFNEEPRALEMLRMLADDGADLSNPEGRTMKSALFDKAYQCIAYLDFIGVPLSDTRPFYTDRLAVFRARARTAVKTIQIACTEAMYRPGGPGFLRARDHFYELANLR